MWLAPQTGSASHSASTIRQCVSRLLRHGALFASHSAPTDTCSGPFHGLRIAGMRYHLVIPRLESATRRDANLQASLYTATRTVCTVPSILRTTDTLSLEARMGRSRCGMPKLENLQGRIYLVHSHPFTSSRSHRMASSSGRPIVVCDVNTFTGKRRNLSRHQLHIHVLRLHPPRLHPTSPDFKDVITNSTDDPSELSLTPVLTT